jgi:hypothetical protein
MSTIVSRVDITQIFCDVDDFCNQWESLWQQVPQLPSTAGERRSKSRMHLSEVSRECDRLSSPLISTMPHLNHEWG